MSGARGQTDRLTGSAELVHVLDFDPDLGLSIGRRDWDLAREACRGELLRVPAGRWRRPLELHGRDAPSAFLVIDGMLSREMTLGRHYVLELLGPGDLFQPPEPAASSLTARIHFTAVEDARLIVLSEPFLEAARRWPGLLVNVQRRLESQRQRLATQGLINQFTRAEDRALLALWHLAERWGRRTESGIRLEVNLTHEMLGHLIGARRPTVTLALSTLEAKAHVRRDESEPLLLTGKAEKAVQELANAGAATTLLGELFAARRPLPRRTRGAQVPGHGPGRI